MTSQLRADARTSRLHAELRAIERPEGGHAVTLRLAIAPPWHLFAPGATQGMPISLTAADPASVTDLVVEADELELFGTVEVSATLTGAGPGTPLVLRTQACNGATCEVPASLKLTLGAPEEVR